MTRSALEELFHELLEGTGKHVFSRVDRALHDGWRGRVITEAETNLFHVADVPLTEFVEALLRARGLVDEHPALVTPAPRVRR